jgi:epoxyqueuosine reductase
VEWLSADGDELVRRFDRLYVPRNDPRYLRRNALVALGNSGGPADTAAVEELAEDEDPMLREHARWALERLRSRGHLHVG